MLTSRFYSCLRTESSITINGDLSKSAWLTTPWTDDFVDIADGNPPHLKTRVKMLWDSDCFYIGAELEEPHLWATKTDSNDVVFEDNDFEIFVDPDGDCHNYVEIEVNALATVWDLFLPKPYRAGGQPLTGWNIDGLSAAVQLFGSLNHPADRDVGWTLEIAVPWRAFRDASRNPQPPAIGETWRVNFSRVQWDLETQNEEYRKVPGRQEHNWVWSQQGVVDMHRPATWGQVQFLKSLDEASHINDDEPRQLLSRLFDLQLRFREETGSYAVLNDISELKGFHSILELETTRCQFFAILDWNGAIWSVDHECKIRRHN